MTDRQTGAVGVQVDFQNPGPVQRQTHGVWVQVDFAVPADRQTGAVAANVDLNRGTINPDRQTGAVVVNVDLNRPAVPGRQTGAVDVNVDLNRSPINPDRQTGAVIVMVDLFEFGRMVGAVGVTADVAVTPDRQAGSVGVTADVVATPDRQAGAVGVNVDYSPLAERQTGAVGAQVDLQNQTVSLRQTGAVGADVDLSNQNIAERRTGATYVQVDLGVPETQVGGVELQVEFTEPPGSRDIGSVVLQVERTPPVAEIGGAGLTVDLTPPPPVVNRQIGAAGLTVDLYIPPPQSTRTVPISAYFSATRLVPLSAAFRTTQTRSVPIGFVYPSLSAWIPAQAATSAQVPDIMALVAPATADPDARLWWIEPILTYGRTVPLSGAFRATFGRSIPAAGELTAPKQRPVPISVALFGTRSRSVPAVGRLSVVRSRTVPLVWSSYTPLRQIGGFSVQADYAPQLTYLRQIGGFAVQVDYPPSNSRSIELSAALLAISRRTIPLTLALTPGRVVPLSASIYAGRRLVPLTASVSGTTQRQLPLEARLTLRLPRPVPINRALLATYSRTVPLTVRQLTTSDRTIPFGAELGTYAYVPIGARLRVTVTRAVPLTARYRRTFQRSVPLSGLFGRERQVPLSRALQATYQKLLPSSARFRQTLERNVPVSRWFGNARDVPFAAAWLRTLARTIPLSVRALRRSERTVPAQARIGAIRIVPLQAALLRTRTRTVPLYRAFRATLARTVAIRAELKGTPYERTVPIGRAFSAARPILISGAFRRSFIRLVPLVVRWRRTFGRTVPLNAEFKGTTRTRTVPLTVAFEQRRLVPMSAAFRRTFSRTVPLSAARLRTFSRTVPLQGEFKGTTYERTVPLTVAFEQRRIVPISGAFRRSFSRTVLLSAYWRRTLSRPVPILGAFSGLVSSRSVPLRASLSAARVVPFSRVFARTLFRLVPISARWHRTLSRTVPIRAELKGQSFERTVPLTARVNFPKSRTVPLNARLAVHEDQRITPVDAILLLRQRVVPLSARFLERKRYVPLHASFMARQSVIPTSAQLIFRGSQIPAQAVLTTPGNVIKPVQAVLSRPEPFETRFGPSPGCGVLVVPQLFDYDFLWEGWGDNGLQQLSYQPSSGMQTAPIHMEARSRYHRIYAGQDWALGLSRGHLYHWGINRWGQRSANIVAEDAGGLTPRIIQTYPDPPPPQSSPFGSIKMTAIQQTAVGSDHCVALDVEGKVWTWGRSDVNQTGWGSSGMSSVLYVDCYYNTGISAVAYAKKPPGLPLARFVTAGENFTLVLGQDNTLWAAGTGLPGANASVGWNQITHTISERIMRVRGGRNHAVLITSSGDLYTFGRNDKGQLGLGDTSNRTAPTLLASNVLDAAPLYDSTLVLFNDGTVRACGDNADGQCGQEVFTRIFRTLMPVSLPRPVEAIGYGVLARTAMVVLRHAATTDTQSEVWGWGYNAAHQLLSTGGGVAASAVPRKVGTQRGVTQIALGANAVYTSNEDTKDLPMTLEHWRSWGEWDQGNLGSGRVFNPYVAFDSAEPDSWAPSHTEPGPLMLTHSEKFAGFYVVRGRSFGATAMDRLGQAQTWGRDELGQLGTGAESFIYSPYWNIGAWTPLPIPNIESGWMGWAWGESNFVRLFEGHIAAWGENSQYQLGMGHNLGDAWLGNTRVTIATDVSSLLGADAQKMVGTDSLSIALLYDGRTLVAGTDSLGLVGTTGTVYPQFTLLPPPYPALLDVAASLSKLYLVVVNGSAWVQSGGLMVQLAADPDGRNMAAGMVAVATAGETAFFRDRNGQLWQTTGDYLERVPTNASRIELMGPHGIGPSYQNETGLWVSNQSRLIGLGGHSVASLMNGLLPSSPNPIVSPVQGAYAWAAGSDPTAVQVTSFDYRGYMWRALATSNLGAYGQFGVLIRRALVLPQGYMVG